MHGYSGGGIFQSKNLFALKKIMEKHELSRADIAKMTNRKLRTVNAWFYRNDSESNRPVTKDVIDLIKAKLR